MDGHDGYAHSCETASSKQITRTRFANLIATDISRKSTLAVVRDNCALSTGRSYRNEIECLEIQPNGTTKWLAFKFASSHGLTILRGNGGIIFHNVYAGICTYVYIHTYIHAHTHIYISLLIT
jgi:hypothetical protein